MLLVGTRKERFCWNI